MTLYGFDASVFNVSRLAGWCVVRVIGTFRLIKLNFRRPFKDRKTGWTGLIWTRCVQQYL